jgi:hypothetical protein
VSSGEGALRSAVDALLEARHGWSLEAMSTPGAPPSWCYHTAGENDLSVYVDGGTVCVYVMATDRELRFAGVDELADWLDANEVASHGGPLQASEIADQLLHGRFVHWGQRES